MSNRKRGFGSVDLLLLLVFTGLVIGGFYFVFHAPETDSPVRPEVAESSRRAPVKEVVPTPSPAPEKPAAEPVAPAVKEAATKPSAGRDQVSGLPVVDDAGEGAFSIEGTVYSLSGGLPLGDCRVSFRGMTVTTGPGGEFRLAADGGVGPLRFDCPGYRPEIIFHFNIEAGSGMAVFDVYLSGRRDVTKGRIEINGVSGRVYDKATGAPLFRAWVIVGRKRTRTDKAGSFELWGNDSGLATLKVTAPHHIGEMVSGIDFDNLVNPLYYEILLEPSNGGKRPRFALVGIGARLVPDPEGHGCRIAAVLEDSPAAREGLEAGDKLLVVDGVAVDEAPPSEVVELIRGHEGEPVDLMVERQGEVLKITCIRERVVY